MDICLKVLMNLIQFTQRRRRVYLMFSSTNKKIINRVFILHCACARHTWVSPHTMNNAVSKNMFCLENGSTCWSRPRCRQSPMPQWQEKSSSWMDFMLARILKASFLVYDSAVSKIKELTRVWNIVHNMLVSLHTNRNRGSQVESQAGLMNTHIRSWVNSLNIYKYSERTTSVGWMLYSKYSSYATTNILTTKKARRL